MESSASSPSVQTAARCGESARRRSTTAGITRDGVVDFLGCGGAAEAEAQAGARFVRRKADGERTCEGSTAPEEQAAPVEHAMP